MASNEALDLFCDEAAATRACAHGDCASAGEYPAPKSPEKLRDYQWFCLDHVREFNKRWNYCKDMTPEEIEKVVRFDTIWNRETRPMRDWAARKSRLFEAAWRARTGAEETRKPEKPKMLGELGEALALFELTLPFELPDLRRKYRALVKKYHPDANGGDKKAEDKLKDITQGYAFLVKHLTAEA